jgi:hypothetical protein
MVKSINKTYCLDCGKETLGHKKEIKRCKKCHSKYSRGSNHPSYKDGRTLKKYYCIECGKEKSTWRGKHCLSCSYKKPRGMCGKKHTIETKEKLRKKLLGHIVSEETKEKLRRERPWRRGKKIEKNTGENNWNWKGIIEKICVVCGDKYYVKSCRKTRKYCSRECTRIGKIGKPSWSKGKKLSIIPWNKNIGGIGNNKYGDNFNNELRSWLRNKYEYTCQICGERGKYCHHIDYNKQNNNKDNFIVLCINCHARTSGSDDSRRAGWTALFQDMIKNENGGVEIGN